jgi:hypothetical protein
VFSNTRKKKTFWNRLNSQNHVMTIQSSSKPFDRGVFIELTSNVASIFVLNVLNVSCTQEKENNVSINCTYWVEL